MPDTFRINRREFLKRTGLAAGVSVAHGAGAAGGVSIILSPDDPINSKPPVTWAAEELERSLAARGISVHHHQRIDQAAAGDLCIIVAGADRPLSRKILAGAHANPPRVLCYLRVEPTRAAWYTHCSKLRTAFISRASRWRRWMCDSRSRKSR